MPRRRPVELNINHERWLVSYADFITLLFAFFVVMYSVSQVNESKYRVLSDTLLNAFESEPLKALKPIQVGEPTLAVDPSAIELGEAEQGEQTGDGAFGSFYKTADLPQLSDQFSERFADLINDQLVRVNSNEFWLQVELKSSILFPSGSAEPSLQAQTIFDEVSTLLKGFDNPVQVEGFTDNVPINNQRYSSNWELSGARAAAVVKLLAKGGVAPERLSAVGYGEYQPVASNDTEAGRAQNRRVVLMIARERLPRPQVQGVEAIERAVATPPREESQPYPQPGLQDSTTTTPQTTKPQQPDTGEKPRVGETKPVELEGGGLLFSSDPELPRKGGKPFEPQMDTDKHK